LFTQLGEQEEVAGITNNLGAEAYFEGRWDDALDYYRQGRAAAERAGDQLYAALFDSNVGEVLVNQGRLEEAEPILRSASRVQRASGWTEGADAAEHYLGRLLVRSGELDEAEVLLRLVYDDYMTMGRRAFAVETGLHLADCLIRRGRIEAAGSLLNDLKELDEETHASLMAFVETELLASSGRLEPALATAQAALASVGDHMSYEQAILALAALRIEEQLGLDVSFEPEAAQRTLSGLGVRSVPEPAVIPRGANDPAP
jgi:tetratricopeptide (TPR) repeat protein